MNKLGFGLIALILLIGLYSTGQRAFKQQPVACTMDALMCPDGSFVGRSGPSCEFSACSGTAFNGALVQNEEGFSLSIGTNKETGQEYLIPLDVKVSNVLGQLVGKQVTAVGMFSV